MISAEKKQELATGLGLDAIPEPRYDDLPTERKPLDLRGTINWRKAILLVDSIRTAAFEFYLPLECVVDMSIDTHSYVDGLNFADFISTNEPPPVNLRITRATGIPFERSDRASFMWLSRILLQHWTLMRPRAMGPPLIVSGNGDGRTARAIKGPWMAILMKFDRRPPDGQTLDNITANQGLIVPAGTKIKRDHKAIAKV